MAPSLDTDSQFKFLIACIKHSNGGKPDFVEVANELGIVSKAAAAKRYERLMKAHNISTKTPLGNAAGASSSKELTASPAKARATKKRKVKADSDEDEAPTPKTKKEAKVKKETKAKKESKAKKEAKDEVKDEPSSENSDADDASEGSFQLSDIPLAPPMLLQNGDGGSESGGDCNDCRVCSSSEMDKYFTHGHTTSPPLPPSADFNSNGAVYSQPVDGPQHIGYGANIEYQSQSRNTPSMTITRRTQTEEQQLHASGLMTWFTQPGQHQNYFWDVVGNSSGSADHGHQR